MKATLTKALWILAALLILIPLSVDNLWSIEVGHYSVRINYFGAALLFALSWREIFAELKSRSYWKLLALLGLVGILGTARSANLHRSLFFWSWTLGTLTFVPILPKILIRRFGPWAPRAFIAYLLVQSVVIVIDAGLCVPTHGAWSIGRHMVYDPTGPMGGLCRPHAWYQEPGYFAAFALLALWVASFWAGREPSAGLKKLPMVTIIATCFALILTMARMGWLGLVVFLAWQAGLYWDQRHVLSRKLVIAVGTLGLASAGLFVGYWPLIHEHLVRGISHPGQDLSFSDRYEHFAAARQVYFDNPIVGAGPGGAGAFYLDHYPQTRLARNTGQRNDPLSMDMYTEVFSEWGSVGAAFFIAFLVLFLRALPLPRRLGVLAILAIVYTSTQTLPRFDLWFALGFIRELGGEPRERA